MLRFWSKLCSPSALGIIICAFGASACKRSPSASLVQGANNIIPSKDVNLLGNAVAQQTPLNNRRCVQLFQKYAMFGGGFSYSSFGTSMSTGGLPPGVGPGTPPPAGGAGTPPQATLPFGLTDQANQNPAAYAPGADGAITLISRSNEGQGTAWYRDLLSVMAAAPAGTLPILPAASVNGVVYASSLVLDNPAVTPLGAGGPQSALALTDGASVLGSDLFCGDATSCYKIKIFSSTKALKTELEASVAGSVKTALFNAVAEASANYKSDATDKNTYVLAYARQIDNPMPNLTGIPDPNGRTYEWFVTAADLENVKLKSDTGCGDGYLRQYISATEMLVIAQFNDTMDNVVKGMSAKVGADGKWVTSASIGGKAGSEATRSLSASNIYVKLIHGMNPADSVLGTSFDQVLADFQSFPRKIPTIVSYVKTPYDGLGVLGKDGQPGDQKYLDPTTNVAPPADIKILNMNNPEPFTAFNNLECPDGWELPDLSRGVSLLKPGGYLTKWLKKNRIELLADVVKEPEKGAAPDPFKPFPWEQGFWPRDKSFIWTSSPCLHRPENAPPEEIKDCVFVMAGQGVAGAKIPDRGSTGGLSGVGVCVKSAN